MEEGTSARSRRRCSRQNRQPNSRFMSRKSFPKKMGSQVKKISSFLAEQDKLHSAFNGDIVLHPVLHASVCWKILSEQLLDLLGPEIHNQWFADIRPVVISNGSLVLQTKNQITCYWINQHYRDLIDLLLGFQDKSLTAFFLAESETKLAKQGRRKDWVS